MGEKDYPASATGIDLRINRAELLARFRQTHVTTANTTKTTQSQGAAE
jgi:hypothetical protein